MSIQTLKELQDQFVAKHGGYFYADPCFPHDNIPRFCADGTDLHFMGSNLFWCAVLELKGTALQEQCGYVPKPEHPENSSYDETRDFWRWSLTMWYRTLVAKATANAEAKAKDKKAPRLPELQQEFRSQFQEQTGQDIVFVHVPVLNIPYPVLDLGRDAPAAATAEAEVAEFSSDTKECWAWMGFLQAKGQELAKAAGVKGSEETRTFLDHKCWGLWTTVTWYENLCWTLNGRPIPLSETLTERDREMVRKLAEPEPEKATEKATIPTLKELQAEFIEINPKRIAFVGIPGLRIPYPTPVSDTDKELTVSPNSEDYWQWIGYIEERGQELASQAGVKASQEPRYAPEHPCWRLWIAVTWYEDLYCTLTGTPKSRTLMERDRDMSAIVARVTAKAAEEIAHRERAHAEDVETLRDLLDAKDRLLDAKDMEIAKLKATLAAIKCIVDS
jgi:hypothetical protein